jgi:glycosyltransferase involved in cell wall biosynthesis
LFFYKANLFYANDLDTLLPSYLHSIFRRKKIIYDSHEYFTEQAEIKDKPLVRKIWGIIEKFVFPKLKYVITVNKSIADVYKEKYKVNVQVMRNCPYTKEFENKEETLDLKADVLWLQIHGTGLHNNRGVEPLVEAMALLPKQFKLRIIGNGIILEKLKKMTKALQMEDRLLFLNPMPKKELNTYTATAFCGFTLDEPACLNHEYILPNKLFDFMHAQVPIVASNTTEVAPIVSTEKTGIVIEAVTPILIAKAVMQLYEDAKQYQQFKDNCIKAKANYCWENEEQTLIKLLSTIE